MYPPNLHNIYDAIYDAIYVLEIGTLYYEKVA